MSSSNSTDLRAVVDATWAPRLDLTSRGLSQFDPARVEQAIAEGYQAGLASGRADAQTAVEAEIARFRDDAAELLGHLAAMGERLAAAEAATAKAFSATVADAAVQIAEAVVGRQLSDETIAATAAIDRVIAATGRRSHVWVQLHPADIELLDDDRLPANVTVEPNPGLDRGDALARTEDRTVDARIQAALERARVALGTPA